MKPTTNVIPVVFRDSLEGMGRRAVRKVVLVRGGGHEKDDTGVVDGGGVIGGGFQVEVGAGGWDT
ncbi:hypothetical protein DRQ11_15250, partial [candidate division KSB1 bacterium]